MELNDREKKELLSLNDFDKTVNNEDEYETPNNLFINLCVMYNVSPLMDYAADRKNTKCEEYLDKHKNALRYGWRKEGWINPPHSRTGDFVRKAYQCWLDFNVTLMMIIPTNTMSSQFWHECIEGIAEYHAVKGRIRFLQNGKPAKYASRNAYVCVIWRRRVVK